MKYFKINFLFYLILTSLFLFILSLFFIHKLAYQLRVWFLFFFFFEPLTTFILLRMQSTVSYDYLSWLPANIYTDTENTIQNYSSETLLQTRPCDARHFPWDGMKL